LILDPKVALPTARQRRNSNKKNDEREEIIEEKLRHALGRRFSAGIFPNAYHIKVAIRDGASFWLSSGNWQSSNQPDAGTLQLPPRELQQGYNREWHVVLHHAGLASLYERFIEWDMQQARPLQAHPEELPDPDLSVPTDAALAAALSPKHYRRCATSAST